MQVSSKVISIPDIQLSCSLLNARVEAYVIIDSRVSVEVSGLSVT